MSDNTQPSADGLLHIDVAIEQTQDKTVEIDVSKLIEPAPGEAPAQEVSPPAEETVEVEIPIREELRSPPGPDPVEELKAQLAEMQNRSTREREDMERERSARERAEAESQRMASEMARHRMELHYAQHQAIDNAISAAKADADALERAYADALRKNDHATAAKAHRAMARTESQLLQLEDGKAQIEAIIKAGPQQFMERPAQQPAPPQQKRPDAPPPPPSPSENYDRYMESLKPRVRSFLQGKDKSWVTDDRKHKKLIAAHYQAQSEGHIEESDSYFDYIDKLMTDKPKQREAQPVKKAVPAAPVTAKAASVAQAPLSAKVPLSPREREMAKHLGITESEYAFRKYKMSQPGWDGAKYDPT